MNKSWSSLVAPVSNGEASIGGDDEATGRKTNICHREGGRTGAVRPRAKQGGAHQRYKTQEVNIKKTNMGAGDMSKPAASAKGPSVFAAPPPNAWGRAAETRERIKVPDVCHGHAAADKATESVSLAEICDVSASVQSEGPLCAVVDSAAARTAFVALASGQESLPDGITIEPVGMENPGNVCFANSVIQALLGCDIFCRLLYRIRTAGEVLDASSERYPVLKAMADIGRELQFYTPVSGGTRAVTEAADRNRSGRKHPRAINVALINKLVHESFSTRYKGDQRTRQIEQEDAHEFLHCLLDGMHKELLKLADVEAKAESQAVQAMADLHVDDTVDNVDAYFQQEDATEGEWLTQSGKRAVKQQLVTSDVATVVRRTSVISEVFEGLQATSIASQGNPTSVTMHPFLVVEIPLYDPSIDTLEAAISSVMATETIAGYRPSGGTGAACEANKSERFQSLPEVLVLHMMRFQFSGSSEKLNKVVRFGRSLRMKAGWMMAGSSKRDRRAEYELVATISHHGQSIAQGHFTANVRHGSNDPGGIDSEWVNLNDECVRPIREDRVLHDTPYMLFYRRM